MVNRCHLCTKQINTTEQESVVTIEHEPVTMHYQCADRMFYVSQEHEEKLRLKQIDCSPVRTQWYQWGTRTTDFHTKCLKHMKLKIRKKMR